MRVAVLVSIVLASVAVAGQSPVLRSDWLAAGMKVDGSPAEWPALTAIAPNVSAAAANDDSTLRLVIATNDPALFDRLRVSGLLVYVDPRNQKAQGFGIRVPPLGGRPLPGEKVVPHLTYLQAIGPSADEMHLVDPPSKYGIEGAAGVADGTWYIELALPLRAREDQPYAPGVAPEQTEIGLGLVTPDPPKAPPPSTAGRGTGGGGGWSFGGFGGGSMGLPPPGSPNQKKDTSKPVKLWTTIELARR